MIKRENPIGKTKVNRFFLEKYEKCEKIHKKRVLAPYCRKRESKMCWNPMDGYEAKTLFLCIFSHFSYFSKKFQL